jgi:hypothetical protein
MTSNGFKYFAFASIISAENDSLTEDVKQDIMSRYSKQRSENKAWNDYDWEYILDPMGDKEKIQRLAKILKDDE